MRLLETAALLGAAHLCLAGGDLAWDSDDDLTTFVTRPELRSPRFDVTLYEPALVTPGYWFVAPYTEITPHTRPVKYYQACQSGPHIYDGNGELVYSGACEFGNQNACDFRAWNINGTFYLSAILYTSDADQVGRGIIMDSSYKVISEIHPERWENGINMHELNLVNNGASVLLINQRPEYVDLTDLEDVPLDRGYILNMGFREIDVQSGKTLFQWWAYPEVSVLESSQDNRRGIAGPWPQGWNWFHGNSVVKNSNGDYLMSSRYTDTIYKISGATGNIEWRLGGSRSDFELIGFNFSRQHDAQWVETEFSESKEIITFLDNGGDEKVQTSNTTSALKIELDLASKTASVIKRWNRPDLGMSQLRGNFQRLPGSDHFFAAWSENAYISEHTLDGRLLMEAEFASRRMVTYRAYKANFTGKPREAPVVKAFVYGVSIENSVTVSYVSWNGATEVSEWHFKDANGDMIGSATREHFETRLVSKGIVTAVYAEAIDKAGVLLGRSDTFYIEDLPRWAVDQLEGVQTNASILDTEDGRGIRGEL